MIPAAVEKLTSQQKDVTDYKLFSLGSIRLEDGDSTPVSLSIFGKVFTMNEQQAYDYLKECVNDERLQRIIEQLNIE